MRCPKCRSDQVAVKRRRGFRMTLVCLGCHYDWRSRSPRARKQPDLLAAPLDAQRVVYFVSSEAETGRGFVEMTGRGGS